jgi:hypothetical protein
MVIGAFIAPAVGTGFLGFLLPCFVYFLAQWMTEYIISKKNHYGGWSIWLASYFMEYRGAMVWKGGLFDVFEARITSELYCTISGEIVYAHPTYYCFTPHLQCMSAVSTLSALSA